MGTPDEEPDVVRFLEVTDDDPPVTSLKYQEMLLDLCDVVCLIPFPPGPFWRPFHD
jgi:protoheme ferro-lyase